jgi:signal-transduction protein with cAMP-binding, CBS, and nucleotidyltransferase domain
MKGRLGEEEYASLRYIVKEIIGFRELTNQMRNELLGFIGLKVCRQGDLIHSDNQSSRDAMVIVSGRVIVTRSN